MRQYDKEYGDIPSQYHDLVQEIMRQMEDILQHEVSLINTTSAISELDATSRLLESLASTTSHGPRSWIVK